MPQDMEKKLDLLNKAALIAEIRELEAKVRDNAELKKAYHELAVHQEEIRLQNEQLIEAQSALEESRNRYADLYDFAPVAYSTLDGWGKIEEINLAGAALLGLERGRLLGTPFLIHVDDSDHRVFLEHMRRCRERNEPVNSELNVKRRNGPPMPVQLSSAPPGQAANQGLFRTMVIDLTERRRAEEERRDLILKERSASASSEAKDRFLAVLSHELRTPLTPVLAAISSMGGLQDLPTEVRSDIEMIRRNIEMEARLIDDLLDITSISKGKLKIHKEVVDVHATLKRVAEMLREGLEVKRLELELRLDAKEHLVQADQGRLQQVFWNLLKNAIKFTQIDGKITVTTRNESQPSVGTPEEPPSHAAPQLVATIADNGIGIEPESLPRLFNAFEQGGPRIVREFGGLGLGLTICRSLVDAHEGWISAFSEGRGKGATFKVGLPTTVGEIQAQPKRPPPQAAVTSRKLKILLVEDHPDTSWILSRLLTTNGHSVKIADSIRSALQCSGEEFDLLISDLGLPDGSGLELMQKLQEAGRPITGIALSGFGTEEDVRRSREAGFREHLTKPVDFGSLLATIHQVREAAGLPGC